MPTEGRRQRQLAGLVTRLRAELADLERAQAATAIVELAKGVLVERLGCSPGQAAEQLAYLAEQLRISVVELAADVVDQAADDTVTRARLATPFRQRARLAEAAAQATTDGYGMARAVFDQALVPLEATSLALWVVEPDGALELAGHVGLSALDASRWQRIPPQLESLEQRVLTSGTAHWWPRGRPAGDRIALVGRADGARTTMPLVNSDAQVGVMEVCWPGPIESFPRAWRRQLLAIAEVCARGIGLRGGQPWEPRATWLPALLDGLAGSVLLAHAVRDGSSTGGSGSGSGSGDGSGGDGEVVDFHLDYVTDRFVDPAGRQPRDLLDRTLLESYPLAAVPGGLFEHARRVHATGEPFRAEHLLLRVLVDDVEVTCDAEVHVAKLFDGVAIGWRLADGRDRLAALLQHAERLGQLGGWEQDLLTGEVLWTDNAYAVFQQEMGTAPVRLEDLDSYVHPDDAEAVALFREALLTLGRPAIALFRLLRPDGTVRNIRAFGESVAAADGTLIAVHGAYQDLSASYRTQVALAATRDQLAESEQLAEDRQALALRLQHAIIASAVPLPRAAGLEVAVRYRPAEQEHLVSGDWYSAVALPTGDVLLVVGDIAGHGIEAVTAMVHLRFSLKGLAVTGAGPSQLLAWLNTITYHLTDNVTATVICGLYDPVRRTLRWARAGHLPPVLVRDGRAVALGLPSGMLLGVVPETDYEETTTVLAPGDTLMLFTDGLVERRGTSLDDAMEALLRIAEHPAESIEYYADHVLGSTTPDTDDDTCLIAVHVR